MDPATDDNNGEEQLVPLKAVDEQREARERESARADQAERALAEARGYERGLKETTAAPAQDAPKELTAAELQQAVDEQRMTAGEAEAIRQRQDDRRVDARIDKRVDQRTEAKAVADGISTELGRYRKALPDLSDHSSATFQKVQNEYSHLTSMGHKNDALTELTAVRAAFGDVSKLEKIGQQNARETHQETGGGRDPGDGDGAARTDTWPKDMPAKNRRYYENMISKGILADRKAAVAQFNYKPKHDPRYAA